MTQEVHNMNDYVRPIPKTEIFKWSLLYFGPSLWNTIPQDILETVPGNTKRNPNVS